MPGIIISQKESGPKRGNQKDGKDLLEKWKNVPPLAERRAKRMWRLRSRRKGRKVSERPFYRRRTALQARNGETRR